MPDTLKEFAKEKKEEKEVKDFKEKITPIRTVFIPLGKDYNAKFNLWDNNLQIVKSRRTESGEWEDYQKINLSKRLLTELSGRIGTFITILDETEEK